MSIAGLSLQASLCCVSIEKLRPETETLKFDKMNGCKRRTLSDANSDWRSSGSTAKPSPELATVFRRGLPSIKIQADQAADAINLKRSTATFVAFLLRLVVLSHAN